MQMLLQVDISWSCLSRPSEKLELLNSHLCVWPRLQQLNTLSYFNHVAEEQIYEHFLSYKFQESRQESHKCLSHEKPEVGTWGLLVPRELIPESVGGKNQPQEKD